MTVGRFGVNREFADCEGCGHPRMAHFGGGCYCGCTAAGAAPQLGAGRPGRDMVGDLNARLSDATRDQREPWKLIEEAARLRKAGRPEEALANARRAHDLATGVEERTAATTLVVAALCDLWRDEEARQEGEAALKEHVSPYLLRAVARAWCLGYVATGLDEFRGQGHAYFQRADVLESLATAV